MRLSIVVAASENNVIGVANQMPWKLPADLKHFKTLTLGKPIVMGRKTFDSIGHPLSGRLNIVISRQPGLAIEGAVVAESIEAALAAVQPVEEVMLIGGAEIYRQALPYTSVVYLTRVHARLAGDAFFPALPEEEWREVDRQAHPADDRHAYAYTFVTLERVLP